MSLKDVVQKYYKSYTVREPNETTTVVDGRSAKGETSKTLTLSIFPAKEKEVVNDPDLDWSRQPIKIYREGVQSQIQDDSIVEYKGDDYKIRKKIDRSDNGEFSMWIAQLVTA